MDKQERTISQEVLEKIQAGKITPKPKWQFLLKDSVVWGAGFTCVLVGALSTAVIIHMVTTSDFDLYASSNGSLPAYIFASMPYFWLVILALFILLAQYNVKHTKGGYRYSLPTIILAVIGASVVFGAAFHFMKIGRAIDYAFEEKVPYYAEVFAPRHKPWSHPEQGTLTGRIIDIENNTTIEIVDVNGEQWIIITEYAERVDYDQLREDRVVRAVGEMLEDMTFQAKFIKVLPPHAPFGPKHLQEKLRKNNEIKLPQYQQLPQFN